MRYVVFAILIILGIEHINSYGEDGDMIVGKWKTQEGKAIFAIYKNSNKYFGKFVWLADTNYIDNKNPVQNLKGRKLLGVTALTNLEYNAIKKRWENGLIYNASNGKAYSCHCTIGQDTTKLFFRGYIGISILGLTQTWTRVE